jgi:lipopolysaccharide/colanic/teichoic acid biosynthesis glycosyltransferase
MGPTYRITKRAFDLLAAAAGLVCLSGLLLLIYALIRATSRGGGIFAQDRAGKGGRVFRMFKFRTMRADHAHDPDPSVVITAEHPAVTPVGRLLRKFKLDELPQLANVLAGQMSLVGPRPPVPEQAQGYDDFQRRRLAVRPGITGLAQVNGGTGLSWPERIQWDVHYVQHCCWSLDLKILWLTVVCTLRGVERRARRYREAYPDGSEGAAG